MIKYSKDDIDYKLAYEAYYGLSFKAEERAGNVQNSYVAEMDAMTKEFSKHVTDNLNEIKAALENYRLGYIKRLNAFLSAQSRCLSVNIAGPSNFPTARNNKRFDTSDKRREEWLTWSKQAKERMRKQFDPVILARAAIQSDDNNAIPKLEEKIAAAERMQVMMKSTNKIIKSKKLSDEEKVSELIELNILASSAWKLLAGDFSSRKGFPAYKLTNNNANIRRMKQRIKQLEREAKREVVEDRVIGNMTISENRDIDRLQLFFPGKPSLEIRTLLKRNGFKWAPSQDAWQRLLNDNARYAVKQIEKGYKELTNGK